MRRTYSNSRHAGSSRSTWLCGTPSMNSSQLFARDKSGTSSATPPPTSWWTARRWARRPPTLSLGTDPLSGVLGSAPGLAPDERIPGGVAGHAKHGGYAGHRHKEYKDWPADRVSGLRVDGDG